MVIVDFKLKILQDLSLKWLYLRIVCRGTKADTFWVLDFALEQGGITQYKKVRLVDQHYFVLRCNEVQSAVVKYSVLLLTYDKIITEFWLVPT